MLVLPVLTLPNCSLRLACPPSEITNIADWLISSIAWPEADESETLPRIDVSHLRSWPGVFVRNPTFGFWLVANLDPEFDTAPDDFWPLHLEHLDRIAIPSLESLDPSCDPAGSVIHAEASWRFKIRKSAKSLRRLLRRSNIRAGKFWPMDKSSVKKMLAPFERAYSACSHWRNDPKTGDVSSIDGKPTCEFGVSTDGESNVIEWNRSLGIAEPVRMLWNNSVREIEMVHHLAGLVRLEKLHSLRRLAYGASHEINNPLANIATRAQTLLTSESDPDRRDRLSVIYAQAMRAHDMISDMMLFAKPPEASLEPTDLVKLCRSAVEEMRPRLVSRSIAARVVEYPDVDSTCVDPRQMTLVLRSLIENSLNAMDGPGEIRIRVFRDSHHWLGLSIVDSGPGFTNETAASAFDPFHSDREAGRGLGFGLSKAWTYLDQIGGRIFIDTEYEGGGKIEIRIPFRAPTARRIDRPIAA